MKNVLLILLLSSIMCSFGLRCHGQDVVYVVEANPWGSTMNDQILNQSFGTGNWQRLRYTGIDVHYVFSASRKLVFLEGSERTNPTRLNEFLTAYRPIIEQWVSNGGRLFINAAPNEGGNMNFGFDGVLLKYRDPDFTSTHIPEAAKGIDHPIFTGPFGPIGVSWTGNYFAHAVIEGPNLHRIILSKNLAKVILAEKAWGSGIVMFGGMTDTYYHSPKPHAINLRANILRYLYSSPPVCTNPVPDFSASTECAGSATIFTDASGNLSADAVYAWDVDNDGVTDYNINGDISHTYPAPGEYIAKLTINQGSCAASVTRQVVVHGAPVIETANDINTENDKLLCGSLVLLSVSALGTPTPTVTYRIGDTDIPDEYFFPVGATSVTVIAANTCGEDVKTFTVTVNDTENPRAVAENITVTLDENGVAKVDPMQIGLNSTDNCGIPDDGYALSMTDFTCDHVTKEGVDPVQVLLTVTDAAGNFSTAAAWVTVVDNVAPVALCQNIEVYLEQTGVVSVAPEQIDAGSADACGVASMAISQDLFTTSDIGDNAVTLTVTDKNGNESLPCDAIVTVRKRPVLLTYSSVSDIQYSDLHHFSATLEDMLSGNPLEGKMIYFTLGGQSTSAITNASGVATSSLIIDQIPGTYQLISHVAEDDIYLAGNDDDPFIIHPEDARITYTGALFSSTSGSTSSSAQVTLSATIQDITAVTDDASYDENAGDIIKSSVTFMIEETGELIPAPVGYVVSEDTKTGTATATWNVDIGSADSKQYTVRIIAGDHYLRNSSEDNTVITVSKPLNDFVTGGGYLVITHSNGEKAGDAGTKNNFGFNIKYNKKGTNLQGNINTIIRRTETDGTLHVYQIKGNAMTSLSVQDVTTTTGKAVFNGKASIQDITDENNPVSVDGNASLQVDMTDVGEPGTSDQIGITVWNKNGGLWFSSNWDGTKTLQQVLAGGNLQVRGASSSTDEQSARMASTEQLKTSSEPLFILENYPNPFSDETIIRFSLTEQVAYALDIYDMHGRPVRTVQSGLAEPGKIYEARFSKSDYSSGVYLARLSATNLMKYIKLIVK